ncbi:MAG: arginine--tRNA ligase [Actinomycetota bacterium]
MIEERLLELIRAALETAADELGIAGHRPEPELLPTKQKEHGDFATNVAFVLASKAERNPREVAEAIRAAFPEAPFVERVEVAGPGFLNIFVTDGWLYDALRDMVASGTSYGAAEPNGKRVQVEFVSANPTGPLHVGHARNAALGDAIARLLEFAGWSVQREYYYNDAGGQMDRFGESVRACYLQAFDIEASIPEDGYHGDYIMSLALEIKQAVGAIYLELEPEEQLRAIRTAAVSRVLAWINRTLSNFRIQFDVFRSEQDLADAGEIEEAVRRLRDDGFVYDSEGATWFRSTGFGDDKDRVLIRSTGAHTYFAADCAYLIDKFSRGFDHVLYVWGADHHGDMARIKGAATALGFDPDSVEMVIYQWVAFMRNGEPVPMSKRAGNFVTLDQLIEEVGTDAARFTLLQFSNDSAVNFDVEAVKQRTMENPVYYVQYGHARIASILRKADSQGVVLRPIADVDLSLLTHDSELDLLRALAEVPGKLVIAAEQRAPHRLTHASQDLAAKFHRFYTECRVVSDDEALTQARLWLATGTKQVIANLLGLLGVSAPEVMDRVDG